MNRNQYLLMKLAEECNEVAQRALKQMQFGKDEVQKGQNKTNAERLLMELNDLNTVVFLLDDAGEIPGQSILESYHAREDKKAKIEKYFEYSKDLGKVLNENH